MARRRVTRRQLLRAAGAAGVTALAGCGGKGGPKGSNQQGDVPEGSVEVMVGGESSHFDPGELEITTGRTVTWIGAEGTEDHQVRAVETPEDSNWAGITTRFLGPEETYSHTFDIPGEYTYRCSPYHASAEIATVVVTE